MSDNLLSQEEIDALLSGDNSSVETPSDEVVEDTGSLLTVDEIDTLGEIGNLSMGAVSTVLSTILNNVSEIIQPQIKEFELSELVTKYQNQEMCLIDLQYNEGLSGNFYLIMKKESAVIIMDLMMGADGSNPPEEPDEIYISAIEEAVNQMMGSSNTSLSTMFNKTIGTTPPKITIGNLNESNISLDGKIVELVFSMKLGEIIDDEMTMVLSVELAKKLVGELLGEYGIEPQAEVEDSSSVLNSSEMEELLSASDSLSSDPNEDLLGQLDNSMQQPQMQQPQMQQPQMQQPQVQQPQMQQPQMQQPQMQQPQMQQPQMQQPQMQQPQMQQQYQMPQQTVYGGPQQQIRPVQFTELARTQNIDIPNNLELLMDVPLQLTVELGRTKKVIKDILDLGNGSVIELEKQAGESIDILVNNKLIAKGEVVVIDENFGVRITSIVSPNERLKNLISSGS